MEPIHVSPWFYACHYTTISTTAMNMVINPRFTCARFTVLALRVCVCVCMRLSVYASVCLSVCPSDALFCVIYTPRL